MSYLPYVQTMPPQAFNYSHMDHMHCIGSLCSGCLTTDKSSEAPIRFSPGCTKTTEKLK